MVDQVQAANKTKSILKKLLTTMDTQKSGEMQYSAFMEIMGLHGIKLTQNDQNSLKHRFEKRGGVLSYKDVLKVLQISFDTSMGVRGAPQWTVAIQQSGRSLSQTTKKNGSIKSSTIQHPFALDLNRPQGLSRQSSCSSQLTTTSLDPAMIYKAANIMRDYSQERFMDVIPEEDHLDPYQRYMASKNNTQIGLRSNNLKAFNQTMHQSENPYFKNKGSITLKPDQRIIDLQDSLASEKNGLIQKLQPRTINQKDGRRLFVKPLSSFNETESIRNGSLSQTMNTPQKGLYASKSDIGEKSSKMAVIKLLYNDKVDFRVMNQIKQQLKESKDVRNNSASLEEFNRIKNTLMKDTNFKNSQSQFLQEVLNSEGRVDLSKLTELIDLYNYSPIRDQTQKNHSNEVYYQMLSNKKDHKNSTYPIREQLLQDPQLANLLEVLWTKISERFYQMGPAFKFFDINQSQQISFNEFMSGIERLRMKATENEARKIFNYLDDDSNGKIGYIEFCELSEEKRRNIDPFVNQKGLIPNQKDNQYARLNSLIDGLVMRIDETFTSIRQAFQFFDINSNRSISLKEFIGGLERLKYNISETDARKIFAFMDYDKNGDVEYDEFCEISVDKRKAKQIQNSHSKTQSNFGFSPLKYKAANTIAKPKTLIKSNQQQLLQTFWLRVSSQFPTLKQAFDYFDMNKSNTITFREFLIGISNLKFNVSESDAQQIFSYMDFDKDGNVEYDEFCEISADKRRNKEKTSYFNATKSQTMNPLKYLLDTLLTKISTHFPTLLQAFDYFDINQSKSISFKEFQNGLQRLNISIADDEARKVFNHMDFDQDGYIEFEEFSEISSGKKAESNNVTYLNEVLMAKISQTFVSLKQAFEFFDVNKSSKISFKELKNGLIRLNIRISDVEAKKVFDHMDFDRDGTVEYDEFCEISTDKKRKPESNNVAQLNQVVMTKINQTFKSLKLAFEYFDTNQSNKISFKEFKKGLSRLNIKLTDIEARKVFNHMDFDQDGSVEFEEFCEISTDKVKKTQSVTNVFQLIETLMTKMNQSFSNLKQAFDYFDVNKSGKISFKEFKGGLSRLNLSLTDIEANKIFNHMDDDQDGSVEFQEFSLLSSDKAQNSQNKGNQNVTQLNEALMSKINKTFKSLKQAFDYFDANRSSKISFKEFQNGLQRLKIDLSESEAKKVFNHMDFDKNGKVEYEEFCEISSDKNINGRNVASLNDILIKKINNNFQSLKQAFDYFDVNKSITISFKEFMNGIKKLNLDFNETEAKKVFDHMDYDNNNFVEYDEFCEIAPELKQKQNAGNVKQLIEVLVSKINKKFQTLKHAFDFLDVNRSGKISFKEFQQGVQKLKIGFTDVESKQVYNHMDYDKDGKIEYEEFCEIQNDKGSNVASLNVTLMSHINKIFQSLRQAFDNFDENKSGKISFKEFQNGLQRLNINFSESDEKKIFNHMDYDRDGKIEYEEFCEISSDKRSKERNLTQLKEALMGKINQTFQSIRQAFDYFDLNKSSRLSFKEFSNGIQRLKLDFSEAESRQVYNFMDFDKDGKIEYEEFCQISDQKMKDGNVSSLNEMLLAKINSKFQTLRHAFDHFDVNKSTKISFKEFLNGLSRLKINLNEPEAKQVFNHMDYDNNGKVEFDEFCQISSDKKTNESNVNKMNQQLLTKINQQFQSLKEAFDSFDINRSGKLSFKEFQQGLYKLKLGFTEVEAKQVFNQMDYDRDGKIEFEEFCGIQNDKNSKGNNVTLLNKTLMNAINKKFQTLRQAFDHLDVNRSSRISFKEFQQGIQKLNIDFTEAQAKIVFDNMDFDRDNKVEYEEFCEISSDKKTNVTNLSKLNETLMSQINKSFQSLRQAFDYFDINKSSKLSFKEFVNGLSRLKINLNEAEAKLVFNHMDYDKNGKVEFNEFCEISSDKQQKGGARNVTLLNQVLLTYLNKSFSNLEKAFQSFDVNQNSQISFKEFMSGIQKLDIDFNESDAKKVFEHMDFDQNGDVDFQEFCEITKQKAKVGTKNNLNQLIELLLSKINNNFSTMKQAFEFFDENRNRTIPFAEFLKGLKKLGLNISETEAKKIFSFMDFDNDGEIEFDEFCEISAERRLKKANEIILKSDKTLKNTSATSILYSMIIQTFPTMKHAFDYFDINKSQTISFKEFQNGLLRLKCVISEGDAKTIFDQMDYDKNGDVEYEEFCEIAANQGLQFQNKMNENPHHSTSLIETFYAKLLASFPNMRHAFNFFDVNKSETISFNEFTHGLQSLKMTMSEIDAHKIFNIMDFDNNGDVEFDEFCEIEKRAKKTNNAQSKAIQQQDSSLNHLLDIISVKLSDKFKTLLLAFQFFDINKNSTISQHEFSKGLDRLKIKFSDTDAKKIFNYMDFDGDGQVEYDEFNELSQERRSKKQMKSIKQKNEQRLQLPKFNTRNDGGNDTTTINLGELRPDSIYLANLDIDTLDKMSKFQSLSSTKKYNTNKVSRTINLKEGSVSSKGFGNEDSSMNKLLNQQYLRDYLEGKVTNNTIDQQRSLNILARPLHTKTSVIRSDSISKTILHKNLEHQIEALKNSKADFNNVSFNSIIKKQEKLKREFVLPQLNGDTKLYDTLNSSHKAPLNPNHIYSAIRTSPKATPSDMMQMSRNSKDIMSDIKKMQSQLVVDSRTMNGQQYHQSNVKAHLTPLYNKLPLNGSNSGQQINQRQDKDEFINSYFQAKRGTINN